jgi:hypothetical protein
MEDSSGFSFHHAGFDSGARPESAGGSDADVSVAGNPAVARRDGWRIVHPVPFNLSRAGPGHPAARVSDDPATPGAVRAGEVFSSATPSGSRETIGIRAVRRQQNRNHGDPVRDPETGWRNHLLTGSSRRIGGKDLRPGENLRGAEKCEGGAGQFHWHRRRDAPPRSGCRIPDRDPRGDRRGIQTSRNPQPVCDQHGVATVRIRFFPHDPLCVYSPRQIPRRSRICPGTRG